MICENLCKIHKNPVNCLLHLIAGILLIYALWENKIGLIILAIVIALIGHAIQLVINKTNKKEKRKR